MHPDYAEVTLRHGDGQQEKVSTSVLLCADGSRSTVRTSLSIPFTGSSFDEPWKLYDLELDPPLNRNEAHAFLLKGGGMFMVRLDDRLWRVIGNLPDLLEHLPKGTTVSRSLGSRTSVSRAALPDAFRKDAPTLLETPPTSIPV